MSNYPRHFSDRMTEEQENAFWAARFADDILARPKQITYEQVCVELRSMDLIDKADSLLAFVHKEMLATEEALRVNMNQTNCWKNRQKSRLIQHYLKAAKVKSEVNQ